MNGESIVRIGVIGAGFIGKVHLQNFAKVPQVELAGLYDSNLTLAHQVASQYGVKRIFKSAEELIGSTEIDAVVIGVPNAYHRPLALEAITRDKHVLLEKPMALTGTEAREIVAAHRSSTKVLMIAHQMRWESLSLQAKSIAQSGDLGKIYNAKSGMLRRKNIPGWGSWFTRMNGSGGGPLIDIGVHVLDLALWLMGNPRPTSVFGSTYAEFGPRKKGLGTWGTPQWDGYFDVEDLATAMIRMEDGSTLTLEVSWTANTDSNNSHFIHLMGNEGGISLYNNRMILTGQKFDRPYDIEVKAPEDTEGNRVRLSRHFVECVREGKKPISDGISGLVNSTIIDSIYRSAQTGEAVKLDWSFLDK